MTSQAAKKNRFAARVQAVDDFEPEPEEPSQSAEVKSDSSASTESLAKVIGTKNKTIELRLDTIDTLKNAVNWQKLLGDGPQTEKDIIETALAEWFLQRGYPRKV